jgi:hypothetical protein
VITLCGYSLFNVVSRGQQPGVQDAHALAAKLVGTHVPLEETAVESTANTAGSLVFVLSTECRFCAASAPFYQRLTTDLLPKLGGRIQTVARLPEDLVRSRDYLERQLGVRLDRIESGITPGVPGTPTLMLTDRTGKVVAAWVGMLPVADEEQVEAVLRSFVQTNGLL